MTDQPRDDGAVGGSVMGDQGGYCSMTGARVPARGGRAMRIRKRPSGFWHVEAFGWRVSVKLTRARWGWRRINAGVWMFGALLATGNVIRLRESR